MNPFNPFNYTLAELQKTVVQAISFLILLATFFIVFDPNLGPSLIAVAVALFGVVGVFASKNATADDAVKAVQSLAASIMAVIALFDTVPTSTTEKVVSLIALAVPPLLVFYRRNAPVDHA